MLELIKKGQPQFKANLHCHSTFSDGKMTPEELKKVYRDRGFSVLAITDHERPADHTALSEDDFLMLTGYEATIRPAKYDVDRQFVTVSHINLFARDPHNLAYVGYSEPYSNWFAQDPSFRKAGPWGERDHTVEYINEFVKSAAENGYLCALNHPYWSMEDWDMIERYEGFFSLEICNYSCFVGRELEYNGQLYENLLRKGKRLFCHSGDDNHSIHPLDDLKSGAFGGFTMILAPELTYPAVFHALETGNFYSSMGPMIHELYIDGDHVHIETDPVKLITMHYGGNLQKFVMGDKEHPISVADFTITPGSPFVRLTVTDFDGKKADTRGVFIDEIR